MWSHPQEVLWSIPVLMHQLYWSEWEMGGATSCRKSSQVASQNGSINFVCWGHIALFQLQALPTKDRKSLGTQSTEISDCSILSSLDRAAVINSTGSWCGTPPLYWGLQRLHQRTLQISRGNYDHNISVNEEAEADLWCDLFPRFCHFLKRLSVLEYAEVNCMGYEMVICTW